MNKHSSKSSELFQKIRNRFDKISMIDENGQPTLLPGSAKIFNFLFLSDNPDTMVTVSHLDPQELKIYFNRNMIKDFDEATKDRWFDLLSIFRRFTITSPDMSYDLIDMDTPKLTVTDIKSMIQDKKQKDETLAESKFSPWEGTKRSSTQRLENVRIKVRHSDVIKDDVHGARSRNISALFIENNQGERLRFPFVNLAGVRAMARHLEEGGDWNDRLGQHILETTHNLYVIKKFVSEAKKQKILTTKSLPLIKQLKEKQTEYRRNLKLMNGSRGYYSYVSDLTETYYEPVESIASYLSALPESVQGLVPLVEKILSERSVETMVDNSLQEYISEIAGPQKKPKSFSKPQSPMRRTPGKQQPAQTDAEQPEDEKDSAGQPASDGEKKDKQKQSFGHIRIPPGLKGSGDSFNLSIGLLRKMKGLDLPNLNPSDIKEYAAGQIPENVYKRMDYDLMNDKLDIPVYSRVGENAALVPRDSYQTLKILFLLSKYDDLTDIPIYIVEKISNIGKFIKGVKFGMDPIGTVRRKFDTWVYKKSGS